MLEIVEVEPRLEAVGTVIWLHGLGADGHDFEPIVPELRLEPELPLRFVFPHAPVRPVTVNGGMHMRAWFDILTLDRDLKVDEAGIVAACASVEELIAREHDRGIPSGRVVLAGFSQGGSLALVTGLGYPEPLAGIMGLSAWLPERYAAVNDAQRGTPVFLAHGSQDPVVQVALGRASHTTLRNQGANVEWHEYLMAHQVCAGEIADIRTFLSRVFSARSST